MRRAALALGAALPEAVAVEAEAVEAALTAAAKMEADGTEAKEATAVRERGWVAVAAAAGGGTVAGTGGAEAMV